MKREPYVAEFPVDPEEFAPHLTVSVPDWRGGKVIGWTDGTITEVTASGMCVVRLDSTGKETIYLPHSIGMPS